MVAATDPFAAWLAQAQLAQHRLSPEQLALLGAAFRFRQRQGDDYYSTRLLSHFLLHCQSGLKVAQLARLLRISRPTASRQQAFSSKQAIQQAQHRMDGRPYGKLLPRYAGPVAAFLFAQPQASRADLIDFIDRTFGVRVSRVALYKFLKKFGLDEAARQATAGAEAAPPAPPPAPVAAPGRPAATPAPPFCSGTRSTPAPSCSCPRP